MTTLKLTSTPAGAIEVIATSNPANIVKIIPVNNMEVVVKAIIADAPVIKVINQTATSDTIKIVPSPGPVGATGPTGSAGPGVATGGTTGQILAKASNTNYDTVWTDQITQENIQDYVAPLFVHNNHTNASVTYEDALNELHIDVTNAPSAGYTSQVKHSVRLGEAIAKGQAVYVSSSNGTNMIVSKASNASEATSSKTMGLLEAGGNANAQVNVITEGLLAGLDTSTATAGDPVWLGTAGNLIYGLANKPYAPAHLVFIGIVTRVNQNNGEIFVKVQNGFELREIHTVQLDADASITNNELLAFESATSLWKNKTFAELGLAVLSGGNAFIGAQTITPSAVGIVPLTINSVASQTANAFEIFDDALTKRFSISRYGTTVVGGSSGYGARLNVQAGTAATIGFAIRGEVSQTANLQEWQDSTGTILASVNSVGRIYSARTSAGSTSDFTATANFWANNATTIGAVIRGAASQSANLQEWQDSAGTILARVNSGGAIVSSGVGVFGAQSNTPNAQLYVLNGNAANPGFVVRGAASQAGDYTTWQANGGTTIAAITSGSSFYAIGQVRAGGSTSFAQLSSIAASATTLGLGIRGAASQTANLTEWQDSAATVLASVASNGIFNVQAVIANSGQANAFGGATVSGIILTARTANAGVIPFAARGAVSQTASLTEWQNSAGTMLYRIAASGLPYFGSTPLSTIDMYTESGSDMALTLPVDDWDDKLRFRYGIYETSTDGLTAWTSATFDQAIIDGRQDTFISPSTASLGHRWTWYGTDLQYMSARYLRISCGYVNPASTISVLFESSADNVTWTSRGSWTGISGYIMKRLFRLADNGADAYIRVTIRYTAVQSAIALENIELLTYRPGNQGGNIAGSEARLPLLTWNGSRTAFFRSTSPDQRSVVVLAPTATASNLTNAVGNGTTITYTTSGVHFLRVGQSVTITGVNPAAYNISGTIATVTMTTFTVANAATGTYVSGGTATITNAANMQEWQNSSGTVVASISRTGIPVFTRATYANDTATDSVGLQVKRTLLQIGTTASEVGAVIRGAASQTADLQQWQNSAGSVLGLVSSTGSLRTTGHVMIGSTSYVDGILYAGIPAAATKGLIVRAAASQTADLAQFQISDSTVRSKIGPNGRMSFGSPATEFNSAILSVSSIFTTNPAIVVRGVLSQTANLEEWQDSTGTVLARVTPTGRFDAVALSTLNNYVYAGEENSGGYIRLNKESTTAGTSSSGQAKIYLRDGTNAGTLKLVIRAGTGAETTILDNIPQA